MNASGIRDSISRAWRDRSWICYLLLPAAALYSFGWKVYVAMYSLGLRTRYRAAIPSVCIGNFTVGGTGKTPVVRWVLKGLIERGFRCVVGVSGYGSPHAVGATIAPSGPLSAAEWGDEAALIRLAFPDVPMVVGRKRAIAARLAESNFAGHVLVMDDGFQHYAFEPKVSLILDPPSKNPWVLPAGPYREPRSLGRKRCDWVVPGDLQIFREPTLSEPAPPEADLLCAVGNPQSVVSNLESLGVVLKTKVLLDDHNPLDAPDLLEGLGVARPLIVTSKDWVKLMTRSDLSNRKVIVADYDVRIEPAKPFFDALVARLNE